MKYDKSSVAGVVVLYDPDDKVIANIKSYIDQLGSLYAVDNSEEVNSDVVEKIKSLERISYLWNEKNLGVAAALNIGAGLAIEQGYKFLFTVDQDSNASPGMFGEFFKFLEANGPEQIGIIAPYHFYENFRRPRAKGDFQEIISTVTSGNMLNLAAYEQAGPFLDALFIDYVDFEYCLRLRARGFKIVQINRAVLNHVLGNVVSRRFIFRKVAVTNHPPVRIYYRTRNRLFVSMKYFRRFPVWVCRDSVIFANEIIKILCFEKEKIDKFEMALLGVKDFLSGRFGKYSE